MGLFLIFLLQLGLGHSQVLKLQQIADAPANGDRIYPHILWRGHIAQELAVKEKDGKIVYRTLINRDPQGFRVVDGMKSKNGMQQHLFFAGCSQTFGEGLNEEETFATLVSEKLPKVRVVNMGLRGGGVAEHYYLWKNRSIKQLYSEKKGLMIYTLIPDHFERLRLTWRYLSWAPRFRPVYKRAGDELQFLGHLNETTRYSWAALLRGTVVEKSWLQLTSHLLPWQLHDVEDEMAFYLSQIKQEYLKQFPDGKFFVSWQAISSPETNPNVNLDKLVKSFNKYQIDFWSNTTNANQKSEVDWIAKRRIPGDGHPNALANKEYADFLLTKLKEKSLLQ